MMEMPEAQRTELRKRCLNNFFSFCVAVMGYDDITKQLHGEYCKFLESGLPRKQATMPRSFVKTWIGSIAYPIWITLPRTSPDEFPQGIDPKDKFYNMGPCMRILIASYVISNAEKMISLIRKTYESNPTMQMLFPEVIPENFTKTKWSNQSACIQRPENFTESTFEAAGIGGSSTSRHYDLIIEDDLIYAKKDDFTGKELQPNQEDIDKAIGWHKLATSLLVPGKHTRIHNTGTRWATHDLVDYIWQNETQYGRFIRGAVDLGELEEKKDWRLCRTEWNECYDLEQLDMIAKAQGPFMFSTQYLLMPRSPDETVFKREWLQFYTTPSELPVHKRRFTTIDLAEWSAPTRKGNECSGVVITCDFDEMGHMWIVHYDVGRFDPSKIIELMAKHWTLFKPEFIGVESVYYQKAVAHFARKYMEEGKIPYMTIHQLKPEGNVSKEIRIRALEPLASNLGIHCRSDATAFISEFVEYVPNNNTCRKDILDALAYQMQVYRPGQIPAQEKKHVSGDYVFEVKMDEVMEGLMKKEKPVDQFGISSETLQPFIDEGARFDLDPVYIDGN
jgi:hypothetical protein